MLILNTFECEKTFTLLVLFESYLLCFRNFLLNLIETMTSRRGVGIFIFCNHLTITK